MTSADEKGPGSTSRSNSRSEILHEGARLIHEREIRLAALDASIERAIASVEAGRVHELNDVAAKLDAKYANMADGRSHR